MQLNIDTPDGKDINTITDFDKGDDILAFLNESGLTLDAMDLDYSSEVIEVDRFGGPQVDSIIIEFYGNNEDFEGLPGDDGGFIILERVTLDSLGVNSADTFFQDLESSNMVVVEPM